MIKISRERLLHPGKHDIFAILTCNNIIMKRIIRETESQMVNPDTGESVMLVTSKTFSRKIEPDKFYMTFIEFIAPLFSLKSDKTINVMTYLCSHARWNTGDIDMSALRRKEIMKEVDISYVYLSKCLAQLQGKGLIKIKEGRITINPAVFWRGDLNMRNQLLKDKEIQITFNLTC